MNEWDSQARQRVYRCDYLGCDATAVVPEDDDQDEGFEAAPGWLAVSISRGPEYLHDFFDYCSVDHLARHKLHLPAPRPLPLHEPTWRDHLAGLVSLLVVLAVLALLGTGLFVTVRWLLSPVL